MDFARKERFYKKRKGSIKNGKVLLKITE